MRPLATRRILTRRWPWPARHHSSLAQQLGLDNDSPDTLTHLHLTAAGGSSHPHPSYATAATIQTELRQLFLDHKAAASASASTPSNQPPPPPPFVLSFTPTPTYTLGRRQGPLDAEQTARLRRPLRDVREAGRYDPSLAAAPPPTYTPGTVETDRGGLTTYHGPGQIVLWPILDIHSPHHKRFTVRSYARLLEDTTRAVLARLQVPTYLSDADPGVWVGAEAPPTPPPRTEGHPLQHQEEERKIAALGVHLRRHITGLGVALNIDVPVRGPEDANPWARFVPCGLEGKRVTSVREELGPAAWARTTGAYRDADAFRVEVARLWALELGLRLETKALSFVPISSEEEQQQAT